MISEVIWDSLRTLSYGLSQFHGHNSWLMCEVTLSVSKSNRLHVVIFRFLFTNLGCILYIPLGGSVVLLKSWTLTSHFSNSSSSFVTTLLCLISVGGTNSRGLEFSVAHIHLIVLVNDQSAMVFWFCVRPTFKRYFLRIIQATMKHDPFDTM